MKISVCLQSVLLLCSQRNCNYCYCFVDEMLFLVARLQLRWISKRKQARGEYKRDGSALGHGVLSRRQTPRTTCLRGSCACVLRFANSTSTPAPCGG
ncbi:uncharacterized protein C8Q71DRAFT_477915 [Rhodofomes roseus]|uniref:Secreted protein n=1 Tax=Rhodofomes roseus TaxID=34475 RepID=A0ABQ8KP65_9APHY|nr:uncharacterized protein C8Q71DRAFT_477915 [Rhodofomes roseus]KAH9840116.1 hypothetical protein C8Q71DRAFT_477915 [Rhodofomes roseus]